MSTSASGPTHPTADPTADALTDPTADPQATIAALEQLRQDRDPPPLCPNRCPHRRRRKIFRRSQIGLLITGVAAIWASELVPGAPVRVLEYVFAALIIVVALSGILPRAFHGLFWWLGLDRDHAPLLDEREQLITMVAAMRTMQTVFGLLMVAIMWLSVSGHGHSPVIYALAGAALAITVASLAWRSLLARRM